MPADLTLEQRRAAVVRALACDHAPAEPSPAPSTAAVDELAARVSALEAQLAAERAHTAAAVERLTRRLAELTERLAAAELRATRPAPRRGRASVETMPTVPPADAALTTVLGGER